MNTSLDRTLLRLAQRAPFYAKVAGRIRRAYSDEIPTACVSYEADGIPLLRVNAAWFDKLTPYQQNGLIVHELLHLIWNHPKRQRNRNHDTWNVATDCCINATIRYQLGADALPDGGCFPEAFGLPEWGDADEYYSYLPTQQPATQPRNFDSHEQWNDSPLADTQVDRIISDAYNDACKEWGKERIDQMLKTPDT